LESIFSANFGNGLPEKSGFASLERKGYGPRGLRMVRSKRMKGCVSVSRVSYYYHVLQIGVRFPTPLPLPHAVPVGATAWSLRLAAPGRPPVRASLLRPSSRFGVAHSVRGDLSVADQKFVMAIGQVRVLLPPRHRGFQFWQFVMNVVLLFGGLLTISFFRLKAKT
jgi:hypothetical protein